jgi:glycolate oxidase
MVTQLGGALSGEHGIGCILQPHFQHMFNDTQLDIMAGIKQVFDPKGILNPGKVLRQ